MLHLRRDGNSDVLSIGTNCWRIEQATRASVIVDADAYFKAAREAMLAARRRIMLIGWDFDARILLGEESDREGPRKLGDFILWLVKRRPELEFYLLRWDVGGLRTLFRGTTIFTILRWKLHPRIEFRLDRAHPTGSSHHQKIVVIDDSFAFCGGIDMTSNRWDTREHLDADHRRKSPGGKDYAPWHDATTALQGPVAAALGDLARERWAHAGGKPLPPVSDKTSFWPRHLAGEFRDVKVSISRSAPSYAGRAPIHEIEKLFLDLIASARRHIYAESQYFAARRIAEAVGRRLSEADGPEIVLLNPFSSHGWLEPIAMDTARARLFGALHKLDTRRRFRIYHPCTADGGSIYAHAKILIVDDQILHIGSSNLNNRSMRLDTECDVTIDARLPGNEAAASVILRIRAELIAEHLGMPANEVQKRIDATGSLIETIEAMRGDGRSLRPYEVPDLLDVEKWLADNEVLDPDGPNEIFESFEKRGLFRRHARGLLHKVRPR
jgi:phosphatidylserine/phosphatidylglycerophosphate/cardiolipin synthase-like enzyme